MKNSYFCNEVCSYRKKINLKKTKMEAENAPYDEREQNLLNARILNGGSGEKIEVVLPTESSNCDCDIQDISDDKTVLADNLSPGEKVIQENHSDSSSSDFSDEKTSHSINGAAIEPNIVETAFRMAAQIVSGACMVSSTGPKHQDSSPSRNAGQNRKM